MGYEEYNDLLLKCQKTGKYRVFTIDINSSSQMHGNDMTEAYYNMFYVIERTYQDLLMLGIELNKQILLDDEGYKPIFDETNLKNEGQMPYDWFIYGDAVGITIHNGSIPSRIVYEIIELNIKEMCLIDNYHKSDLVYETDKYQEGHDKYFRGYAIQMSMNMHKPKENPINIPKEEVSSEEIHKYMELVKKNHEKAVEKANQRLANFNIHNRTKKK